MADRPSRARLAHQRAEQAELRVAALRELRLSGRRAGIRTDDVDAAMAHARDAYDHLIFALRSSAQAHERAAARYLARAADGDVNEARLKARGVEHLQLAQLDLDRAERLRKLAFGPGAYAARSAAW